MKSATKYLILVATSVILAITTILFGALPMRVVRKSYGRLPFWMAFMVAAAGLIAFGSVPYGILVLALAVVTGVYAEVEEHGGSAFTSGFVATLAAIGVSSIGVGIAVYRSKIPFVDSVRAQVAPVVDRLVTMNPNSTITPDLVLQQLPSGLVVGLILALSISLIGERRLLGWAGVVQPKSNGGDGKSDLSNFRVPDVFVWLTIAAIFGAFVRHGNALVETISLNVLNVLVVVFFFQGLAIVSHAFRIFRVSPFWQWLWYLVLVAQLFLLVSLVGFADFWMEFRERLTRKPAESNKGL